MFSSISTWRFTLSLALIALFCSTTGSTCTLSNIVGGGQEDVQVLLSADFGNENSAKLQNEATITSCPSTAPDDDSPDMVAGLDCDGDGGVVRFVTPSTYKVAIKRLAFLRSDDGDPFEAIADTGTLSSAQVLDLTQPVGLEIDSPPAGVYSQYLVEFYYFELTMPMYDANTESTIRIYMSDDDFPAEGNLGHHQGDITLIDDNGVELGFVDVATTWQVDSLLSTRGNVNGAGGTDSETGHLRGLFGDELFWNQAALQQGSDADIYRLQGPLNLVVGGEPKVVRFVFDVEDTWFFEDFDGNERFDPCAIDFGDACNGSGAWAPLFTDPEVNVEDLGTSSTISTAGSGGSK